MEKAETSDISTARTFQRKRRPPLNFDEMGVPIGAVLDHVETGESVEVVEPKRVRLRGEIVSLTPAQQIVSGALYAVQPGKFWMFGDIPDRRVTVETRSSFQRPR